MVTVQLRRLQAPHFIIRIANAARTSCRPVTAISAIVRARFIAGVYSKAADLFPRCRLPPRCAVVIVISTTVSRASLQRRSAGILRGSLTAATPLPAPSLVAPNFRVPGRFPEMDAVSSRHSGIREASESAGGNSSTHTRVRTETSLPSTIHSALSRLSSISKHPEPDRKMCRTKVQRLVDERVRRHGVQPDETEICWALTCGHKLTASLLCFWAFKRSGCLLSVSPCLAARTGLHAAGELRQTCRCRTAAST